MSTMPINIRRELAIVLITICCSVLILPGLILVAGSQIFGAYGSAGGFAGIYAATLNDLLVPTLAAWIIVAGPALCVVLLRLTLHLTQPDEAPTPASQRQRREPTISA